MRFDKYQEFHNAFAKASDATGDGAERLERSMYEHIARLDRQLPKGTNSAAAMIFRALKGEARSGELPVVTDATANILIHLIDMAGSVDVISCLACLLVEMRPHRTRLIDGALPTVLITEAASYATWEAMRVKEAHEGSAVAHAREDAMRLTSAAIEAFKDETRTAFNDLEDKLKQADENLGKSKDAVILIHSQARDALANIQDAGAKIDTMSTTFEARAAAWEDRALQAEQRANEVEAHTARIDENLNTLSVKRLWDARAKASRTAFWVSAILLVVFLIAIPASALGNLDAVLSTLKHIGDVATADLPKDASATQQTVSAISRLIIVTVPLALYFWIIRLLVRFNLHSLTLMEDARQRHTMMDTYFHLIGQQAAVKEDRALILNALFRPTPGQGGDNVDPPNFTELLDKAISKA